MNKFPEWAEVSRDMDGVWISKCKHCGAKPHKAYDDTVYHYSSCIVVSGAREQEYIAVPTKDFEDINNAVKKNSILLEIVRSIVPTPEQSHAIEELDEHLKTLEGLLRGVKRGKRLYQHSIDSKG